MKSALGMGIGFALEALMPLVRLIVLARLLPQDEFGIAVTVLVTLGIVEMCTDLGLAQSAAQHALYGDTAQLGADAFGHDGFAGPRRDLDPAFDGG
jgi:O-antigen/teichoic acid export membrane protein